MSFRNEFAKMVEDIRLGPDTPKEEADRILQSLLQLIRNNLPG